MTIAPTTTTTQPRAARPIFPEAATGLASGAASQDAAVYGRTHRPKHRCPAGPRAVGAQRGPYPRPPARHCQRAELTVEEASGKS